MRTRVLLSFFVGSSLEVISCLKRWFVGTLQFLDKSAAKTGRVLVDVGLPVNKKYISRYTDIQYTVLSKSHKNSWLLRESIRNVPGIGNS